LTKAEFTLRNDVNARTETFPVTTEDMEKLRPETDLNDTIVHNYIKLLQLMFLPMEVDQKTHIFSSFFLEKLIGDYVKDEFVYDKEQAFLVQQVQEKVR
jgi:Ulp1 family protease